MSKPLAVLISDVHYSLSTLDLADNAFRQAIDKAAELGAPLVDCGDLTNDKAILRGEVVNALLSTMVYAAEKGVKVYLLVGNHSLINEKGTAHVLNFLAPFCTIIQSFKYIDELDTYFIPYMHDTEELKRALYYVKGSKRIIMHQGVQTAFMGSYVQDKTSLPKEVFADFRVISGHYHRRQDIKCGPPRKGAVGLFSYVGNPYTLSFAEADDGPKGFQILLDNGLLEFVPTNLRKHVTIECEARNVDNLGFLQSYDSNDFLWIKISGSQSELDKISKEALGTHFLGHTNYKLDKIVTQAEEITPPKLNTTPGEILDSIIDKLPDEPLRKAYLKALWKELV